MTGRSGGSPIIRALVVAALILAASAALGLASPQYIGAELARRLWGAMLGAVVVVYANAAPKVLIPLTRLRCAPSSEQALRRFSGWAIVLGGLGYAAAWLLVPIESAGLVAMGLLGTALLLVIIRCGWAMAAGATSA